MKKTTKDAIVIGFALFSMFFGAGNLIFPGYLGMQQGSEFGLGMLGFLITGVGLPLLAILACSRGDGTFESIGEKINKRFASVFTTVLFLAIGPLLAVPRTAATTFEVTINPFFPKVPAIIVILLYFLINIYFVLKRSSIIDTIGKYLTPALLLLLVAIIIKGFFMPVGTIPTVETTDVFSTSLLEGYQTMDAIAALLFAAIITSSIKDKGYKKEEMTTMLIKSSIVAVIGLAFVYGGLMYLGAQTSTFAPEGISKTELLSLISRSVLGQIGPIVIGFSMGLACLSTSIGLITAGSDFFETISKGKLKYKFNAIIISIVSFCVALLGVDKIVVYSAPILNLLYPVSITIMVTAFLTKFIDIRAIRLSVYTSLLCSLLFVIPGVDLSFLPLSSAGFGWLIPTIAVLLIGAILFRNKEIK
ncbi:MAG: branched-chain amino acid transport system II carrier protein [Clostridiaceae bacterium]|nr:branched-chain amino acid transport system II carrier protein [Clostridiaceae bacterium]